MEPAADPPDTPPVLAIFITAPEDPADELAERLADFAEYGVKHVFVVNPYRNELQHYANGAMHPAFAIAAPELNVEIPGAQIFPSVPRDHLM